MAEKTNIAVDLGNLAGPDGNAFCVMAKVTQALRRNGHEDLVEPYKTEAMAGDYDNLLAVTDKYVDVV